MIIIYGAGGFAREVVDICDRLGLRVGGFLVDEKYGKVGDVVMSDNKIPTLSIIGNMDFSTYGHKCIIAIGDPSVRQRTCDDRRHYTSWTQALIDPSASIGRSVHIGHGTVICAGVRVTCNIDIGHHVHVNLNSTIGHDCRIRKYVTIAPGVNISGKVRIEEGVFIGTGASILEGVTIGKWAKVGAGAVVIQDVPECATVVGVPAKVIKIGESKV